MSVKEPSPYNLVAILGPTASGKTRLAVRLAREMGSEIVSADSRQVYRGMNIGTGKDLDAYRVEGTAVPYHGIDVAEPSYEFSVFDYQRMFYAAFTDLRTRGIVPVLVGGTGLYIESILRSYRMAEAPENPSLRRELRDEGREELIRRLQTLRPTLHNTTDLTDRERLIRAVEIAHAGRYGHDRPEVPGVPGVRAFTIGIRKDPAALRAAITKRLRERLEEGLIAEVQGLVDSGVSWDRMEALGLEYRCVSRYLRGRVAYEDMVRELETRIHQYAKRQRTWFRRMERLGVSISWVDGDDYKQVRELVGNALGRNV